MALKTFCVAFVFFVLLTQVFAATLFRKERSNEESDAKSVCKGSTPCGWAVYKPFTRIIEYYMQNTCQCPKDKMCTRTDDDISVSAYVYRCKTSS